MKIAAILIVLLTVPATMTACKHTETATASGPVAQMRVPAKAEIIQRVMSLPAYALYEETPEAFRKRLETVAGYHPLPGQGAALLSVTGDGCFGDRIFRMEADGTLHILIHDWEDHPEPYFNTATVAAGSTEIQYGQDYTTPPAKFSPAWEALWPGIKK